MIKILKNSHVHNSCVHSATIIDKDKNAVGYNTFRDFLEAFEYYSNRQQGTIGPYSDHQLKSCLFMAAVQQVDCFRANKVNCPSRDHIKVSGSLVHIVNFISIIVFSQLL